MRPLMPTIGSSLKAHTRQVLVDSKMKAGNEGGPPE